jgi:hypothetical protein
MESNNRWKTLVLFIGGLAGLVTGLAAAALVIKRRETTGVGFKLNSGEGFKIGMGVVGLLRQISETVLKK